MESLAVSFGRIFEVIPVETDEQLRQALYLRYQVYCLETGFEDVKAHPDHLERDEFDGRSVHSLLLHKESGIIAGTVRLVLPDKRALDAPFPIEKHSGDVIDPSNTRAVRPVLAEISRFCISKEFKRRMSEANTVWGVPEGGAGESSAAHKRMIPHITMGLFAAVVQMSARNDMRYWYAVMEPALLRLLRRFGIHFQALGPMVDYHGLRQPCFASADEVLSNAYRVCRPGWDLATERGKIWPLSNVHHLLPPAEPLAPYCPAHSVTWAKA